MDKAENLYRKHSLFAAAAMIAPVMQASSGESWVAVAAMAVAGWLLGGFCQWGTGWKRCLQSLWGCVWIAVMMKWSTCFWQEDPYCGAVPLVLLVLAAWTVSVPEKAQRIGCVLLWPLVILLGAVLLSGASEIERSYLRPVWEKGNLSLFALLLVPGLAGKKLGNWKVPLMGLITCVITTGVLSTAVSRNVDSGVYELSRSLSLLGLAERFESLVAAAMTMGFYAAMTYFMKQVEGNKVSIWIHAGLAAVIYWIGPPENGLFLMLGSALLWLILPHLSEGKFFSKKGKKGIDKTDFTC